MLGVGLGLTRLGRALVPSILATGGTVSDITVDGKQYRVHTFTASDDFVVSRGGTVEYLIVGGGGGGGGARVSDGAGGGGGAGGYLESTFSVAATTYSVVVGSGGTGGGEATAGQQGNSSSFAGLTSIGGGGGGSGGNPFQNPTTGGSGGGSGGWRTTPGTGASGTTGQGNEGGDAAGSPQYGAGGGGGSGGAGADGTTTTSGNGGAGKSSSINGSLVARAGGGGGGRTSGGATPGIGQAGGGNGGGNNQNGFDAVDGTGSGGGGVGTISSGWDGGDGGDGVVIIRYPFVESTAPVPFRIPGLAAWWDASDVTTITESGGAVSQINDKSGNGRHLVQPTAANQPATGVNTVNGRNVLSYDGDDDMYATSSFALGSFTMIAVWQHIAESFTFLGSDSDPNFFVGSGVSGSNSTSLAGAGQALTSIRNNGSDESYATRGDIYSIFDAQLNLMVVKGSGGSTSERMSPLVYPPSASFSPEMRVCEVLLYDATLTSEQVGDLEAYLSGKWGVTLP